MYKYFLNLLILSLLLPQEYLYADACFTQTYCSVGNSPKYVVWPKGWPSGKETGLQFRHNCKLEYFAGDVGMFLDYSVKNNIITIKNSDRVPASFLLSKDKTEIVSNDNFKYKYASNACKK